MYSHSSSSESSKSSISENDENELIKMFKLMNSISGTKCDLKALRYKFFSAGIKVTEPELTYLLKMLDTELFKPVKFRKFKKVLQPYFNQEHLFADIRETWDLFPKEKDGVITQDTLRGLLVDQGVHVDKSDLESMLALLDKNGDGVVDMKDFAQYEDV